MTVLRHHLGGFSIRTRPPLSQEAALLSPHPDFQKLTAPLSAAHLGGGGRRPTHRPSLAPPGQSWRRDGLSTRPEAECQEAETFKAVRPLQSLAGPQPTARKPAARLWFAGGAPSSLRMCWRRGRGAPRDSDRARRAREGTPGHDSSPSILPAPTTSWSSFLPSSHPPETLSDPKGWALGSLRGGPSGASPAAESTSLCP